MKSRILVAVIGVPVLLYVVLAAPPLVMMIALELLAGTAAWELLQCVGGADRQFVVWNTFFAVIMVHWYVNQPDYAAIPLIAEVFILFTWSIFEGGSIKFKPIMAAMASSMLITYSFSSFCRMEASGIHRAYLLLPFILSFACDTFAFFAGLTLGKHKLAPKVSPKKTIEGSIGGLLGNVVCGLLFAYVMDRWFGGSIGYGPMVLLALFCGVVAQIGDLSFSLIKREFGIKDYGRIFLAHGGVLDRFDSVLFVAPVVEIVFRFFS